MDGTQLLETVRGWWQGPSDDAIITIGRSVRAVLVVALAVLLLRLVQPWLNRRLRQREIDPNVATLLRNLSGFGVYLVAFSIILGIYGASWSAVLTVVGASTIAISFSLQDLLKSYVAGVYLLVEQPIRVGDDIRVKEVAGVVEEIQLRTTRLVSAAGEMVIIPNSTLFLEIVTNYSRIEPGQTKIEVARLDLPLREIADAVTAALTPLSGEMTQPPGTDILNSTDEGITVRVTLHHQPGADLTTEALTLLRERFPRAALSRQAG